MTKLFIGYKPGVGGVVKVMRNNSDDPLTTPNTAYGKFLFNSENSETGYVKYFTTYRWLSGMSDNEVRYFPNGTNLNNCERRVYMSSRGVLQWNDVFPSRILGRGDEPYVYEFRPKKALGALIDGPLAYYQQTESGGLGENLSLTCYRTTLSKSLGTGGTTLSKPIAGKVGGNFRGESSSNFSSSSDNNRPMLVTAIDLPADNSPVPSAPTGAAGTRNTIITPAVVRIGKGGVQENPSNRDSMIIDSNRVPMKIVKAGQVNVANDGGTVTIPSPVTLGENTYLDYMVWDTRDPPRFLL